MAGRIIAIEGVDASGKRTQAGLLLKKLRASGKKAGLLHFPRYSSFFGKIVKSYLQGKFGSKESLPPEFCALLYALDKYDAAKEISSKLRKLDFLVLDRYTASNAAHQGAKFKSAGQQKQFISWVQALEGSLPKPSATVFIDMPVKFSLQLMKARGRAKDLHESDAAYLQRTRDIYLRLSRQKGWVKINCIAKGKLKPRAQIHDEIFRALQKYLK